MQTFAYAVTGALILLALPTAIACGGEGQEEEPPQYCHDYTIHVGDESDGLHANEKGQFQLAMASTTGMYVEQDIAYTDDSFHGPLSRDPWLFSLWIYFESNDRPGLQRGDEVCQNTREGEYSDTIPC